MDYAALLEPAFQAIRAGRLDEAAALASREQANAGLAAFPPLTLAFLWSVLSNAPAHRDAAYRILADLAPTLRRMPASTFANAYARGSANLAGLIARDSRLLELIAEGWDGAAVPLKVSSVATLAAWCARRGETRHILDHAAEIILPPTSPFSSEERYRAEDIEYAVVPGGIFIPGWDATVTADGTVLMNTGQVRVGKQFPGIGIVHDPNLDVVGHYWPEATEYIDEVILPIPEGYLGNFGHWLIGILPRLRIRAVPNLKHIKIAIAEDLGPKERETLAYFGIKESDLIICRRGVRYAFKGLCAGVFGTGMPPHPDSVRYVRQHLYEPNLEKTGRAPKRVFVRRGEVNYRYVHNEAALEELLAQEGFVSLDMAGLSWAEQRRAVAGAEVLLGLWGSNLFATYLAPEGCNVIVLWPPNPARTDPTIVQTCAILGQRHQYFRDCAYYVDDDVSEASEALIVDIPKLRERLRSL